MRRRTSLPRLKIVSNTPASVNEHAVPPTPSVARPKTGVPALTVESLVARNKEAGEPLDKDSKDAEEEFPYQFGPKEILPGLFLGSEQNAKDPAILSRLGITQVICCAKEVSCPWLAEEISSDDDPHGMSSARQISAGSNSSLLSPDMCSSPSQPLPEHPASTLPTSPPFNVSRTSSPSRPAFLRPAVSTPNLKEKKRGKPLSPLRNDVPLPISPEQMLPTASFRAATSHSGYLHRYFPANRSSGRPALQYTKLPWGHDEDDIARHFETYQICEMVDRARRDGGRCLVHCQLGVSRSATLMIGYCMRQAFCNQDASLLQEVKTMHDSYTYVRSKSRWVAPNIGLLVSPVRHAGKIPNTDFQHILDQAQLVQYERVLTAENMPNQPLPYSNSAYYDSQLSLPNMQGSRTPDNLSPSSTSESEEDSHLTTPEFGSDLVSAAQEERKYMQVDALNRSAHKKTLGVEDPARLSPMTAALGLARPADPLPRLVLEKVTFGSAQRKREHRKTFSADFSKLPLAFTKHHDNA